MNENLKFESGCGGSPACPARSPDSVEQRTAACVPGSL